MALRDLFTRKQQPSPLPHPAAPIALARAPTYQPVPTAPADPLDAEVVQLWLAFQRQNRQPTWERFIAWLVDENRTMAKRVADLESDLANIAHTQVFRP